MSKRAWLVLGILLVIVLLALPKLNLWKNDSIGNAPAAEATRASSTAVRMLTVHAVF